MPDLFVAHKKTEKEASSHAKHVHMFCSFCINPEKISFNTQEQDEKILLFIRRHFVTNTSWIVFSGGLLLLPLLFFYLNNIFHFISDIIPYQFLVISLISYYLLILTYAFINFITWYFNIVLITDKRVVDIDFSDLVYKNVAETKLSLVQDVSYAQVGALSSLFNYGNILIQTAGSIDNFELAKAPNPQKIVDVIENLIGKGRHAA